MKKDFNYDMVRSFAENGNKYNRYAAEELGIDYNSLKQRNSK